MSKYHSIIRYPLITEKNTKLREKENKYVFDVPRDVTKGEIKETVEKLFNVTVESVNTIIVKGKKKRMGRFIGYKSDRKKAIVKIKKGQTIAKFGEV